MPSAFRIPSARRRRPGDLVRTSRALRSIVERAIPRVEFAARPGDVAGTPLGQLLRATVANPTMMLLADIECPAWLTPMRDRIYGDASIARPSWRSVRCLVVAAKQAIALIIGPRGVHFDRRGRGSDPKFDLIIWLLRSA